MTATVSSLTSYSRPGNDDRSTPQEAHADSYGEMFRFSQLWRLSTTDSNTTLHSFRRFKVAHLLNLRYLESEISDLDRNLYQTGLHLPAPLSKPKGQRLALEQNTLDPAESSTRSGQVTEEQVLRLRGLINEYGMLDCSQKKLFSLRDAHANPQVDEALFSFNRIMNMETVALADDPWHARFRADLNEREVANTRLIRADMNHPRTRSPVEILLKSLFRMWFNRRNGKRMDTDVEAGMAYRSGSIDTTLLTQSVIRFLEALSAAAFLVVPLVVLSGQQRLGTKLLTIGLFITAFCFLIAFSSWNSPHASIAAAAAYAAVLSVFISAQS